MRAWHEARRQLGCLGTGAWAQRRENGPKSAPMANRHDVSKAQGARDWTSSSNPKGQRKAGHLRKMAHYLLWFARTRALGPARPISTSEVAHTEAVASASCPPDSNKRSRSAVITDSRERAHFETPRPGPSAQGKKPGTSPRAVLKFVESRHPEFFWSPFGPSISVALHSGGHMKPPGAPEVPMDARKRKGLIGTKLRGK